MTKEVLEKILSDQEAAKLRKEQYRHDWKISIFNTCAGGLAGLITSVIFWLITN